VRQLDVLNELQYLSMVIMVPSPGRPAVIGAEDAPKRVGALNGRLTIS